MKTAAQLAHERLMLSGALRIRTVVAKPRRRTDGMQGARTQAECRALREAIVELVAQGKNNIAIADELSVTPQTVSRHRRELMKGAK